MRGTGAGRAASTVDVDAVADRWLAGDRFGVLLTGDPLHAEELFRALAPRADRAFGTAEAVTPEDLAAVAGARVVALAWDRTEVHPALLRRCTAVLVCGSSPAPPHRGRRVVGVRPVSCQDAVAAAVLGLHAAGVHDHGLDLAAAQLAAGLAAGGCPDPAGVVQRVVVLPRAAPGTRRAEQPDGETGGGDDRGDDGHEDGAPGGTDLATGPGDDGDDDGDGLDAPPGPSALDDADGDDDDARDASGPSGPLAPPGALPLPAGGGSRDTSGPPGPREPRRDSAPDAHGDEHGDEHGAPDGDAGGAAASRAAGPTAWDPDPTGGGPPAASPSGDDDAVRAVLGERAPGRGRIARHHLRGRSGAASLSQDRGPVVRVVSLDRAGGRVAVVPSLRLAAQRRAGERAAGMAQGGSDHLGDGGLLRVEDLRGVLRRRHGGSHTVVVLDRSSSLGASGLRRASSAADTAVSLVAARRGVVSVVVAAGARARLVVDASTSLVRARAALLDGGCGGGTPLSDAVRLALEHLVAVDRSRRCVVLLTDGRPTVALSGRNATEEELAAELSAALTELVRAVPDVSLVPLGPATGAGARRARAPFLAAGVRVVEGR